MHYLLPRSLAVVACFAPFIRYHATFLYHSFASDSMTSELNVVPSLRALAFNRLAERYRKFENKGREDQLVLMLSKLPVTLIPEFMRRKAALDAIEAADDVKEVVTKFSKRCSETTVSKFADIECEICDHTCEIQVDFEAACPEEDECEALEEITREQANKRQKLLTHHLAKSVCPDYGFAEDSEEDK